MKEIELAQEQLEEVNGGMIIERGFWHNYWIVSDYNGRVLGQTFFKSGAEDICESRKCSKHLMSLDKYNNWMDIKDKRQGITIQCR